MKSIDSRTVERIKKNREFKTAKFRIRYKKAIFSCTTKGKMNNLYDLLCEEAEKYNNEKPEII